MAKVRTEQAPKMIKRFINAKKRVLTATNDVSQLASPGVARTPKQLSNKNSIGPKGGSNKSSVPANRTYLKTGKTKPAAPKVTKAKLDPKAGGSRPNQASTRQKSVRINYSMLKRTK